MGSYDAKLNLNFTTRFSEIFTQLYGLIIFIKNFLQVLLKKFKQFSKA